MAAQPKAAAGKKPRKRSPKHGSFTRAYRFAMVVPQPKAAPVFSACNTLCGWRNQLTDLLRDQRTENRSLHEAGEPVKPWLRHFDLIGMVKEARKADAALGKLHTHLAQNVCGRVIEGTKRWLEARKGGDHRKRPPRRVDPRKYRSFTFPEYGNGCRIQNGRVFLSGFGWFKLHDHRKMRGRPKTVTVKWAEGRWWCIVTCQIAEQDWFGPQPDRTALPDGGGDPGLEALLADSEGNVFDPPRALEDRQDKVGHEQKAMARKFTAREAAWKQAVADARATGKPDSVPPLREMPYSNRLRKNIRRVGRLHTKAVRVRDYHHKKIASVTRDRFRRFGIEEHGLQFMIRNSRMARRASDRAIGGMKHALASAFGSDIVPVPTVRPGVGGNSQTCLCENAVPKTLRIREHVCDRCGLVGPRDYVSANIVQLVAFGSTSETLVSHYPDVGQTSDMRGVVKAGSGESRLASGRKAALEVTVKRGISASSRTRRRTAGGEPTAEAKTLRNPRRKPRLPSAAQELSSA